MSISEETLAGVKRILGVDTLPLCWSEKDLAELKVRSLSALRRDRVEGGGIPFVKFKGQVRYRVVDVLEWIDTNVVRNTLQG